MNNKFLIVSLYLILLMNQSCTAPEDFGRLSWFDLDDPAYNFDCGSFENFHILGDRQNFNTCCSLEIPQNLRQYLRLGFC
jgi:hypothetical protein